MAKWRIRLLGFELYYVNTDVYRHQDIIPSLRVVRMRCGKHRLILWRVPSNG